MSTDPLFTEFPPPLESDWLRLAGSDFVRTIAPGVAVPALQSSVGQDRLFRDPLLQRLEEYRNERSIRADLDTLERSSEIPGCAQIGTAAIVKADDVRQMNGTVGVHLRDESDHLASVPCALALSDAGFGGSYSQEKLTNVPLLLETLSHHTDWLRQSGKVRLLGLNLSTADPADPVAVVALACCWTHFVVRRLSNAGVSPAIAARHLHFILPTSNNFWLQIGFLRACRVAISSTLESLGLSEIEPILLTTIVRREPSAMKPEQGLIHYTAAACSSMIGGADLIAAPGLQVVSDPDPVASQRLLALTQLTLIHESGLKTIADPASGSAYAEAISTRIDAASRVLYGTCRESLDDTPPTPSMLNRPEVA